MEVQMNELKRYHALGALFILFLGTLFPYGYSGRNSEEKIYYAIEKNGQICGYCEVEIMNIKENGMPVIRLRESVQILSSALGKPINTKGRSEYRIDPETGQFISHEYDLDSESLKLHISASIEGKTARIILQPGGGEKAVLLPAKVLLENPYYFPNLLKDSGENSLGPKRYQILDEFDRNIHEVTVTKKGDRTNSSLGKDLQSYRF